MSNVIQLMDDFTVYNVSAFVTSGISIVLNIILIVLIVKKTSKDMSSYQNVLLQTCVVDITFALVSGLTIPQAETSDYRLFFRVATPWFSPNGIFPCLGLWFYIWALSTLLWSMMIQAIYRYFIVVRRLTPSSSRTWMLQSIIFFLGMIVSLPSISVPCQNTDPTDNDALTTMGLWKYYPELHSSFRSVLYRRIWFILFTCLVFGLSIAANVVFFVLTWRVKKCLQSSKMHFSVQTMKTHKQFERKLMLQSIMPCFSLLALSIIFLYIFALPPEDANVQGGMLLIALMPLQYIIVLNPVITLLSIKSYRNAIFCRPNSPTPAGTQAFTIFRTSSTLVPLG